MTSDYIMKHRRLTGIGGINGMAPGRYEFKIESRPPGLVGLLSLHTVT